VVVVTGKVVVEVGVGRTFVLITGGEDVIVVDVLVRGVIGTVCSCAGALAHTFLLEAAMNPHAPTNNIITRTIPTRSFTRSW
jgi:hypothetical protein